jgi:MFS family permease
MLDRATHRDATAGIAPGRDVKAAATGKWYVLAIMTAIMTVHHVDRNVISVIVEPVKHEFGLSDTKMGALTGFAHSSALALFVLPMGWLADRVNRIRLISAVVTVWSAMTALGALAGSYAALLLMRFCVGAAEAGAPPASVSVLADIFPPRQRPDAMGIYYLHVAFGTGLIFLGGGVVAQEFGWRAAFLLAGLPGLMLGLLLLFTVTEPIREAAAPGEAAPGVGEVARSIGKHPTLLFMLIAGASATAAQTSVWAWMASFFMRTHGLGLAEVGIIVAVAAGVAKGLGSALSGPLVRIFSGNRPRALWRFPALMLTLSIPLGWAMTQAASTAGGIAGALALGGALGCWAGPAMVVVVAGVPSRIRATSVSLYHLSCNLVGASAGPLLTGLLSDTMHGGRALGSALAIALSVNLIAALGFFLACRNLSTERM